MSAEYKVDLDLVSLGEADEAQRPVLEKARAQVGFVPNMYAAMVNAPGVLDTYLHGYKHFRENSLFSPVEQEVVLLVISRENGCHYCMAAHSVLADKQSKVPETVTNAIRAWETIPDEKLRALARFTQVMTETRGLPSKSDVEAFHAAGYSDRHILDIVLAQAVKTLSNYSNHLFHTPVDDMFASRAWEPAA